MEREALLSLTHFASAGRIAIISRLVIVVIAMASLPVAIVAGEFGAAMAFGVVVDLMKMSAFGRLRIS